jgi:pimeloyl-ACP methyl ester carboxylesterase
MAVGPVEKNMVAGEPHAFSVEVSDEILTDVKQRLERVRWPLDPGNSDWSYGVDRAYLEDLVDYWINSYDWRSHEREMNHWDQFKVDIDGIPIHYIHAKGKGPSPVPLILSHGWPWTFWDYKKVIGPLTDPAAYGGDPKDAFDVIVPSLPGFGFSSPLDRTGVNFALTSDIFHVLMRDVLGYEKFAAAGGDFGAHVSAAMGHKHASDLYGVWVSLISPTFVFDVWEEKMAFTEDDYEDDEKPLFRHMMDVWPHLTSHMEVQARDPQTLAYGLHDSPVGLAAWLIERRLWWGDCNGDIESRFSKDDLITTAMIYWVTETFYSSARYYAEAARNPWRPSHDREPVIEAPTGLAVFPKEVIQMPRSWQDSFYNVVHRKTMDAGGHFAPMEEPNAVVEDIREFLRPLRP